MRSFVRSLTVVLLAAPAAAGCGSAVTLTVRPSQPAPAEIVPSPKLSERAYKRLLLLPPESPVDVKEVDIDVVREKQAAYYTAKLEKLLLGKGFEVLSPEIVARAEGEAKGEGRGALSAAEKAMVLGQKTKADAVFMLQSVGVRGASKFYDVDESHVTEVEPGRVRRDEDDGHAYEVTTERCLTEVPYYELRVEGKVIDTATGTVLWVGAARQTTIDAFKDSWVADIDDECHVEHESFIYGDYLRAEATLDRTTIGLLERLLTPLSRTALAGKVEEPKEAAPAPPPPPPPPPPAPAPKPKVAVVSSARAALRDAPNKRGSRKMDVPRKAKVEVVETMGEWIKVKVQDGTEGWMHESTLIVED